MRVERILNRSAWCVALVLGQASTLLGVMITVAWTLAIAVVLPPRASEIASGAHRLLPIEFPLIGIALAMLALLVSSRSREPVANYAIAGLVFNGLPLVMTILFFLL